MEFSKLDHYHNQTDLTIAKTSLAFLRILKCSSSIDIYTYEKETTHTLKKKMANINFQ